jgi:hypothetical protein
MRRELSRRQPMGRTHAHLTRVRKLRTPPRDLRRPSATAARRRRRRAIPAASRQPASQEACACGRRRREHGRPRPTHFSRGRLRTGGCHQRLIFQGRRRQRTHGGRGIGPGGGGRGRSRRPPPKPPPTPRTRPSPSKGLNKEDRGMQKVLSLLLLRNLRQARPLPAGMDRPSTPTQSPARRHKGSSLQYVLHVVDSIGKQIKEPRRSRRGAVGPSGRPAALPAAQRTM